MKAMIKKEFYLQKRYYCISFGVIVLFLFISNSDSGSSLLTVLPSALAGGALGTSLSSFSYDDLSNSEQYIWSIPVSTRAYVRAKYLVGAGLILLYSGVGVFTEVIAAPFHSQETQDIMITSLGGWTGVSLVFSLLIPAIFYFGISKIGFVMTGLFLIMFSVSYMIGHFSWQLPEQSVTWYFILAAAQFVVLYLSYRISLFAMAHKRKKM